MALRFSSSGFKKWVAKKVGPLGWGKIFFLFSFFLVLIRLLREETPGHFRMAYQAGIALWQGQPAYGVPFLGNLYFYSPACGMFLYAPFGLLPEKLGLMAFSLLSGVLFFVGFDRLARIYLGPRSIQWAWAVSAPYFFSSMAAHKTETISTGLVLLASAWMIEARRSNIWSALFFGATGNWKLQSLPPGGLLSIQRFLTFRDWKWPLGLAASFGFFTFLPFAFRPWDEMAAAYRKWNETLSGYSRANFDFYDNFFSFLGNNFGLKMAFEISQIISAVAALVLAAVVAAYGFRSREKKVYPLLALSLGYAFTMIFSPLQQVNAYLPATPLLIASIAAAVSVPVRQRRRRFAFLAVCFFLLIFAYSELIPEPLRGHFRHAVLRVPAMLGLLGFVIWDAFRRERAA